MTETMGGLLATYGYVILFLLVGLESMGIPLPGETALVTAAALAARGHLSIYAVIATAAAAAILGDNGGYWIGRTGGIPFVRRYGRVVRLDERHLERAQSFFRRHGAKTVFIGRFVALLRTWAALLAGLGCMPYGIFTAYNAAGGITWSLLFGTLGYLFGRNLPALQRYIGQVSLAFVLLAALIGALALAGRWLVNNRRLVVARLSDYRIRLAESPVLTAVRARHPKVWTFVMTRFARGEYT